MKSLSSKEECEGVEIDYLPDFILWLGKENVQLFNH